MREPVELGVQETVEQELHWRLGIPLSCSLVVIRLKYGYHELTGKDSNWIMLVPNITNNAQVSASDTY